jgi:hypothetical protein
MGEGAVGKPEVESLAAGLRAHQLDIRWGVETVLRSRAFFAVPNIRTRVLGPVEFVVGTVRSLELLDPPPSTLVLADWCARLGQDLFNPPNVGGWPGGRSWLSARSLIGRANLAAALVEGRGVGRDAPFDPAELARRCGRSRDGGDAVRVCAEILTGSAPDEKAPERLRISPDTRPVAPDPEAARTAVARLIASPDSQIG